MDPSAIEGMSTAVGILQQKLNETTDELERYKLIAAPFLIGGCPDIPKCIRVRATNFGESLSQHDLEELLEHGLLVVSEMELKGLGDGPKRTILSPAEPGSVLGGMAFYNECVRRVSTWRAMLFLAQKWQDPDEPTNPPELAVIPPDYSMTWDGRNLQLYSYLRVEVDSETQELVSSFLEDLPVYFEVMQ